MAASSPLARSARSVSRLAEIRSANIITKKGNTFADKSTLLAPLPLESRKLD